MFKGHAECGVMNEIALPITAIHRMTVVVMGALLVVLCSCQQSPADPGSLFSKGLQRDAWRTVSAYDAAVWAHREKFRSEIPPAYWEPSIQRLHPVKVYTHRVNLVVVQHVNGGTEQGKYISLPVSSFRPVSSYLYKHPVDGFVFRPAWGNGVFNFTRTGVPNTK